MGWKTKNRGKLSKLERGLTLEQALQTTRMVDADVEFVKLAREKLLFENEYLRPVIGKVVVCRDPREYDDSFNGTDKTNAELHNHSEAEVAATKRYGLRW